MNLLVVGVLLILAAAVAGAAISPPARASRAFQLLFAGGSLLGVVPAILALGGADVPSVRFEGPVPGGPWVFGLDTLSAVFLVAIFGVGTAAALYGVTYLQSQDQQRPVRAVHSFLAVLVAALALVVTARATIPFLIAWEVMAVVAFALVVFEHGIPEVRRAGLLYLVATHTGTLTLFALFALWGSGARDLTFAALAEQAPVLPAGGIWIFLLALIGFGLKAGIVPFHFWLPEAHAAAPSHISAVLSGVVIKMGIYGLLRVFSLLGPPPPWYAWLLLVLGAASGVLGVVWALAQHDLKRLLAFHSVENIGIIVLGLGAGTLGMSYGHPTMAVIGFAGAALHTLNHALFKSLLFLGAGSVLHATGVRDVERLGGLARRMPVTATTFLIGSAAIVGLPPLNGFLSEWLVLRSLLSAGLATNEVRIAILAAAVLGLIGALALACFAKVVGIVFLGTPREALAVAPHESPRGMTWPLIGLAGSCAAIGLLPLLVLPAALRVGAEVAHQPADLVTPTAAAGSVTIFSIGLASALIALWLLRGGLMARRDMALAETWACGFAGTTARMQYTASSFAAPLLTVYRSVAGIHVHRGPASLVTHSADPVLSRIVLPAWRRARTVAERVRPLQRGRLSLYLLYIAAALVTLLLYLLLATRST